MREAAVATFRVRAIAILLGLAVGACVHPARTSSDSIGSNSFVITNVRVFDGTSTIEVATVIVRNGLIDEIGKGLKVPDELPVIDGSGKTLVPGLIDAHTHSRRVEALAEALRFGVTTELDMFTDVKFAESQRPQRTKIEHTSSADLWSAGTLATSPGGYGTEFGINIPTISSSSEAEAFVGARTAEGSDYIKIIYESGSGRSSSISRESLDRLVEAAHAHGKLAVVHISTQEGAFDAVDAGADGLANMFIDSFAQDPLVKLMTQKRTFVVATLTTSFNSGTDEKPWRDVIDDPRLARFLSARQLTSLSLSSPKTKTNSAASKFDPSLVRASVVKLADHGVDVLAGTDAGNVGIAHGASLHGEIAQLVRAGLTPVQALAAATSLPAKRFGLKDRGRIAPNLRADLVLVNGDPTSDITATRAIIRIFKNGYQVDRSVHPAEAREVSASTDSSR